MSVHARLCVCCAWERDTLRGHASAYVSVWKGGKAGHLWDWCSPLSPRACDADGASQRNEYINYKRKRAPRPSIGYSPGSPKRSPNDLANDAKVLPVTGRSASCSAPLHPPRRPARRPDSLDPKRCCILLREKYNDFEYFIWVGSIYLVNGSSRCQTQTQITLRQRAWGGAPSRDQPGRLEAYMYMPRCGAEPATQEPRWEVLERVGPAFTRKRSDTEETFRTCLTWWPRGCGVSSTSGKSRSSGSDHLARSSALAWHGVSPSSCCHSCHVKGISSHTHSPSGTKRMVKRLVSRL